MSVVATKNFSSIKENASQYCEAVKMVQKHLKAVALQTTVPMKEYLPHCVSSDALCALYNI